jgi:2-phospho-L-lactate guanylyltransferase
MSAELLVGLRPSQVTPFHRSRPKANSKTSNLVHVFAAVPVKRLAESKKRLSSVLTLKEREALTLVMLRDVLESVTKSRKIDRIVLVSPDRSILKVAQKYGATCLIERGLGGMNSAIKEAIKFCIKEGAESALVIPADIPSVTAKDLDEIVALGKKSPVVISPSHNGSGTNALLLSPPDIMPPAYGRDSFRLHLERASALGLRFEVYRSPRIALDIDTPKDLLNFKLLKTDTYTQVFLNRTNLAGRIKN